MAIFVGLYNVRLFRACEVLFACLSLRHRWSQSRLSTFGRGFAGGWGGEAQGRCRSEHEHVADDHGLDAETEVGAAAVDGAGWCCGC